MEGSRFILALILVLCASNVLGHSYLTAPISRSNQRSTNTGCRGPACLGPCDISSSKTTRAPLNIARGASISVQWPRNNHAGGFIRLAWAPTSSSDSHASFDNGVQVIVCHEVGGCVPASKSDPNGGDTGPADGSSQACTTVITVPLHLTDGLWTLQWAWYGGAFALGDYYSCVDYKVSGGPSGSQLAAVFNGGDYTYPGQNKCKFFNTDRLHRCVNEPCNNPVYPGGERSGPAYMGAQVSSTTTTSTTTTSTTGPRPTTTTTTSTTGPRPTTTTTTSTTGRLSTTTTTTTTSTSGSGGSGTGGPVATTTGTGGPVATTTTGNTVPSGNCASLSNVVSSTKFQVTSVELWGASIRMEVKFDMSETVSNWMVQIIWPEGALDTTISTVYNAGVLKCSANAPIRHSMAEPSSWANPVRAGQSYYIEFLASNTNMNKEFLMANMQFRMFKQ